MNRLVPPFAHRIDPDLQFCVRCLRTEQELAERFVSCMSDEEWEWTVQQVVKRRATERQTPENDDRTPGSQGEDSGTSPAAVASSHHR